MARVSVRAGILVTGTEVLSGCVTDRNGPWLSERLGELGVEVTQITIVGDRPEDLETALRGDARAGGGPDRHQRRPRARPPTTSPPRWSGASPGASWSSTRRWRRRSAAILAEFAKRLRFDPEALREANRKQAMIPEGATAIDPAGTAPGLVVPADGQVVIVLPGPPRELQAMWPKALETEPVRESARARRALQDDLGADVRDPRVRAGEDPARDRGRTPT